MVTGVSGSGKSEYAEQISCQLAKDNKKYYVATMYPYGEDGRSRVKKHKLQRDGKGFETIEQYQNIGGALKGCKRDTKPVVLVECMSNLLANECFEENGHPDNIFADYIRRLGELNVKLAKAADTVVEVVYTIPVVLKGDISYVGN